MMQYKETASAAQAEKERTKTREELPANSISISHKLIFMSSPAFKNPSVTSVCGEARQKDS